MSEAVTRDRTELGIRRRAALSTRTDISSEGTRDIAAAMNGILADVFALYLKTKNFHWHMSGPHFRETEQRTWFLFEAAR
jgi:starvation-inducible DNA-binding protein